MTDQSTRPYVAPPVLENIPTELKARRQWVCWAMERRGDKWTKVPYTPGTVKHARANAPSTWRTVEEAYAAYLSNPNFFAGIGYEFLKDDPFVGVDFDHCIDEDGVISEFARLHMPHTYAEISQSGRGIKAIARAAIDAGRKTPNVELYGERRFFAMTGNILTGMPRAILPAQPAIDHLIEVLGTGTKEHRPGKPGGGGRGDLAAAIPNEMWEAGRHERRKNITRILARLRASVAKKPKTQLAYILREDYRGFHEKWSYVGIIRADGSIDNSQIRAVMANSIKMRGFTFPEFAALMSYFYGTECTEKWGTPQGVREEFATLWYKARAPRIGEYIQEPAQPVARGRAGAHTDLLEQAYQILVSFKAGIEALLTVDDLAEAMGVHNRTASGLISELVEDRRITRRKAGQYGGLVIGFADTQYSESENSTTPHIDTESNNGTKDTKDATYAIDRVSDTQYSKKEKTATAASGAKEPVTDVSAIPAEPRRPSIYIYNQYCVSSAPGIVSENAELSLPDLARHYLEQPAVLVGELLINQETGVVTYRRSSAHFAGMVKAEYLEADAIAAYRAEQARKRREEKAAWERFFSQLKKMSNEELIAYIAGGCRRSVAELSRDVATFDQHLYKTRLSCAKRHLEWRGIQMPEKEVKQKAVTPKKREERGIAAEQAGFLEMAEPQEIPRVSLPSDQPIADGIVERLKALKRQKEDTQLGSANQCSLNVISSSAARNSAPPVPHGNQGDA